jgi:hypothetical protein
MNGQRLGDLEESDQLEPIQPLGAGLIAVDLGQACVNRGIGGDGPVDVGVPEEPADAVHHRDHRGVPQTGLAELPDVQLDVGSLDPDQGIETVVLAPGEPPAQLELVESVGSAGIARQVGHRSQLGRRHRNRLQRQKRGGAGHVVTSCGDTGRLQPRPPPTRRGTRTT